MEKDAVALEIDPIAQRGFEAGADAYERGRADYPADAVRRLVEAAGIRPGSHVIDLGAGTGKFTRLLVPTQATLLAVEPVKAMRHKFASVLPGVKALEGSAEAMPVEDGWADAVFVAQAFHWFNGEKTLAECHRVLKPGGVLGLVWNVRDESVDWIAELTRIIDVHERSAPRYRSFEWEKAFKQTALFGPLQQRSFAHAHKGTVEAVVDRVASTSFIAALPDDQRGSVLDQTRDLLLTHPSTAGSSEIETKYLTEVYWCKKL
jgi:ubiquinone/menaquinone biosynthesis C-methylase UbiE